MNSQVQVMEFNFLASVYIHMYKYGAETTKTIKKIVKLFGQVKSARKNVNKVWMRKLLPVLP